MEHPTTLTKQLFKDIYCTPCLNDKLLYHLSSIMRLSQIKMASYYMIFPSTVVSIISTSGIFKGFIIYRIIQ